MSIKTFTEKCRKHPLIFWIGVLASIATLIVTVNHFWPDSNNHEIENGHNYNQVPTDATISINSIKLSMRGPLWDWETSSNDEIVVVVQATGKTSNENNLSDFIVAFWRLANAYTTNWHIGRRRVGSFYELAQLDSKHTKSGSWEFIVSCNWGRTKL